MKISPPRSERLARSTPEIDLQKLFENAGVPWQKFESDWNQAADVYRTLIWGMANIFPDKGSTEMTHVEFLIEPGEQKKNWFSSLFRVSR